MRILFCGNTEPGWTGRDRIDALEASGFHVRAANSRPFIQAGTRIERSLAARWQLGRGVVRFNRLLRNEAARGGYDIVIVDKGLWIWPDTLAALKASARQGIAIHFTPDAQFLENRSRHFFRGLPLYDLAVTSKPFEVEAYNSAGVRELKLIHQGYGGRLRPVPTAEIPDHLRSEVCFIGHCQPHYARVLEYLAASVPLTIWGPNWTAYARDHAWARQVVRGEGFFGEDYVRALSGAKIAIGLLSKRIPETTTTRSFEIPACGTMLLAERTGDHQALFEEGWEAEFFDSPEECVEKASRYLADATSREAVAAAGLMRSRASGYSTAEQFGTILDWIQKKVVNQNCLAR